MQKEGKKRKRKGREKERKGTIEGRGREEKKGKEKKKEVGYPVQGRGALNPEKSNIVAGREAISAM